MKRPPEAPAGPRGPADAAPLVVLVDDLADLHLIVVRLGQRAGHRVVSFARAEDAWEFLRHERPDLVLLDRNLPGMSGLELCRLIRDTPALAGVPVALFSQGSRPDEDEAAQAAGADFFLSKDLLCRPEAWQRRLGEILNARRQDTTG